MNMIDIEYPEVNCEDMVVLYTKCLEMLKLEPWLEMYDFHVVVIVDPDSKEKQLAVVMGQAQQVFALHLYQPDEGTRFFTKLHLQGMSAQLQHDAQYDQRVLSVDFVPKDLMGEYDETLLDKFGSDEWSFLKKNRNMGFIPSVILNTVIPGSPTWHTNKVETRKLLDAISLMQRFYTTEFEEYEVYTFSPEVTDGEVRISLPTYHLPNGADRDDVSCWKISIEEYVAPAPKETPETPKDDLFAKRLEKYPVNPSETWEVAASFLPTPLVEDNYPYYGVMGVAAVQSSGFAAGNQTELSSACRHSLMRRVLENAAAQLGYLPHKIVVASPIAETAFAQISQKIIIAPAKTPDQMSVYNEIISALLNRTSNEDDLLGMAAEFGDDEIELLNSLILQIGELDPADEAAATLLQEQIHNIPGAAQMLEQIMGSMRES